MCSVITVIVVVVMGAFSSAHHPDLWQECSKLFHPQNYLDQLPPFSLSYVSNVPIPSIPLIKPTPVITTKVINVVTKYINRNPVCIRVTSKKPSCKIEKNKKKPQKNANEHLVSKEYFVKDRESREFLSEVLPPNLTIYSDTREEPVITESNLYLEGEEFDLRPLARSYNNNNNNKRIYDFQLQTSEAPKAFIKPTKTPTLTKSQIKNLLIEDRLDHLEQILPHYTRQRVYQTSTITITKVLTDNKPTATLLVKNCIPLGIERCPPRKRKRKSKVAKYREIEDIEVNQYYG